MLLLQWGGEGIPIEILSEFEYVWLVGMFTSRLLSRMNGYSGCAVVRMAMHMME